MATPASSASIAPLDAPKATTESQSTALGDLLRSHRERRGLTLQQIANETKIPLRHLQALEGDNLSVVPAGLYQRAEIRAFARAVRLDPELALAQLERDLQTAAESNGSPVSSSAGRERAASRNRVLAVVGVVAVALFLGFATRNRENVVSGETTSPPKAAFPERAAPGRAPEQRALEPPAAPATAVPTQASAPSPPSTPAPPQAPPALAAPAQSPVPDAPVPTAGDTPDETAPLPARPQSELVITSEPAGARVTIDGVGWGETPLTVRHLPAGAKRIRVTKGGYQGEERVVQVGDARRSTLHISLQSTP
jgi:cytoskeleton protein RodZ